MKRLSVLSLLLLVALLAVLLALFVRLQEEALYFVTGPLLGSVGCGTVFRRDRWAFIKGGAVGGSCQGIVAVIVLRRGYVFEDIAMITGSRFLMTLAVHLGVGLGVGALLYLALRWARPRNAAAEA